MLFLKHRLLTHCSKIRYFVGTYFWVFCSLSHIVHILLCKSYAILIAIFLSYDLKTGIMIDFSVYKLQYNIWCDFGCLCFHRNFRIFFFFFRFVKNHTGIFMNVNQVLLLVLFKSSDFVTL